MEDADDPSRYATQPSQNDNPAPKDQHYYAALKTHLQMFLPFLAQIINNNKLLDILPNNMFKLKFLYQLVNEKSLSPDRLQNCKKVLYDLYSTYGNALNYHLPPDFKTSWMQETKLTDSKNEVSSDVKLTSYKINQNQSRESELPNNIPEPDNSYKIVNDKMGSLEDLNTINKSYEYVEIDNSYDSKHSTLVNNDLPVLSDSSLRHNKIIGFAANASISKLNESDASIPYTDFNTQNFDEMIKQKNGQAYQKDISKGININDIDTNCVKDVKDDLKRTSCVEPIPPQPLPPLDLMNLRDKNVSKITDEFIGIHTDKGLEIKIPKTVNTDGDLKIKTRMLKNKSKKYETCPKINLEETTISIQSKVNKDALDSKSKQNCILIDHTDLNKPKKQKNHSKEKEFVKNTKDTESLNDDILDSKGRIKSSEMKKGTLKTLNVKNLKPTFYKDITTKVNKKLKSDECSKHFDNVSVPKLVEVCRQNKIEDIVISSPLYEQPGAINSKIETSCKSQEENIVSSSEMNSIVDNNTKIDDKVLIDFLKNPKLMNVISMFQDKDKMEKLNELLENSDVKDNDDELKQIDIIKEQLEIVERKMENGKKEQRKIKKNVSEESSIIDNENEFLNSISDDNNINQLKNIVKTRKENSHSSTDQNKSKSKESLGNFEILKDKSQLELKQLKKVITKLDTNIKRSEICDSDITGSYNIQSNDNMLTNNKQMNAEISQEIKYKKPFSGPLSVKLARQQMEMKLNNSQNQYIKNDFEFDIKKVKKVTDKIYTDSLIDFDNLLGCLPPIQSGQVISKSKDNDNQNQQLTELNEQKQSDSSISIQKICNEQNIDAIVLKSIIDENPPESLGIHKTPQESVYKKNLPESNILQFFPEQANQSPPKETRISADQPEIKYSEYTLKEKSKKCVLAGLTCELINSILLFKCSVSSCIENQFSTTVLIDFYQHIIKNHTYVIWNGNCAACHHKSQIVSDQFYVRNALEHLVSHHLVLKNTEKYPNTIMNLGSSKNESLSPICQNTVKNTPTVENPLRICLPDDELSMHFMENNITCENSEQNSKNILLGNQCRASVNLNITNGSNDKSFPLLNSRISDVKKLKKRIVNTSEIKSNASDNYDLNMRMKAKTNCEVVLPNSEICLEAGQQIVNNGVPINGTISFLIDTAYTKDYIRKVRDFPMNVIKTRLAFNEMSALPRLLCLFKCMGRNCSTNFSSKELFKCHLALHFSRAETKKKKQIYNVEHFKMCAYCFKAFDDEESLANHIVEKYTFCEYFCPHCFYRAYTASHVLVHQSVVHTDISKNCIIKLKYDDRACKYPKEMLLVVDFKEFVLPYKCNVGCCGFSCYLHNEFVEHFNQEHQQCAKFYCYICANKENGEGFFALHPSVMVTHFKLHNINKYQCIFCLFGSEIVDSMIEHLAFEHFEYEPLCLERSAVSDDCESKNIRNLKILRLKKVIDDEIIKIVNLPTETISDPLPQQSKKRSIKSPDVLSVAMKSARIEEGSQPSSDTIDISLSDSVQMAESSTSKSLAVNNEFIIIDDDDDVTQNDMHKSLRITRVWSEYNNEDKNPNVSSNDDIVIDDENDVNLSRNEELNEDPTKQICLKDRSNKAKRFVFPIIELDNLFFCKECKKGFSNGEMYCAHLISICPFWDGTGKKCLYCAKVFKTPVNLTEHIKLHGPNRFKCYLCNFKVPSQRAIKNHMKNCHKIQNINFIPERPNLIDLNKDDFIVFEDETVEQKKQEPTCNKFAEQNVDCEDNLYKVTQEQSDDTNNSFNSLMPQQNGQQITRLKRKQSTNVVNKKGPLKVKPIFKYKSKNMFFSPDTIDSIPRSHIFSDKIICLLCTYSTKVRSNLVLHLNGHKNGQYVTKEIVNPVPSIGKSELMFDKMINLSASSFDAMNTDKMKRDELDKKIIELVLVDDFNADIFPQFIPINIRYKCSIPLCTYIGITEDMLKKHISVAHPTYKSYVCPHCLPPYIISKVVELNQIKFHLMHHGANLYRCQYCEYIDFNRIEMKTHMRNTHLSEIASSIQSNIIVIRQKMLEDENINRDRIKAPINVPQWVCNICSNGLKYTENQITSHIIMAHKVSSMFKCPMCHFEYKDDSPNIFKEHYKLQHPSVAVKCLRVFEKITDNEEIHQQSKPLYGTENMLQHQALESIEPTLVPPSCRGIPVEPTPLKTNSKSYGVSKNPKSTTISSSIQSHKQTMLKDIFIKLGQISSDGHFVCPKCYVFKTINIDLFREHLYKEVNYKINMWKCPKCFEISDSFNKMSWHVEKHGLGVKCEKIEDSDKLKWVDQVIGHQHNMLLTELNKKSKAKQVKSLESSKTAIVNYKRKSYSPT